MALPVTAMSRPAVLNGRSNGRLPDSILENIPGLAAGPTIRLVAPAARAWQAMQAHATREGIVLKASGPADSYRPYEVQERIFRQRYTTSYLAGRPTRQWNGRVWYQKPGTAAAAVPGTSNHGWALAVDTGTELDGDAGTEPIDRRTLDWLLDHAATYGWSWELQSEPWHIRYVAGDNEPAAVTAYHEDDDMALSDDDINRIVAAQTPYVKAVVLEALAGIGRALGMDRRLDREALVQEFIDNGMPEAEARDRVGRIEAGT